jgi:hypothetical protein
MREDAGASERGAAGAANDPGPIPSPPALPLAEAPPVAGVVALSKSDCPCAWLASFAWVLRRLAGALAPAPPPPAATLSAPPIAPSPPSLSR